MSLLVRFAGAMEPGTHLATVLRRMVSGSIDNSSCSRMKSTRSTREMSDVLQSQKIVNT